MLRMFVKTYNQYGSYVGYSSTTWERMEEDIRSQIDRQGLRNISRIDIQIDGKVFKTLSVADIKAKYAA